jgi:hypothetical protein
MWPAMPPQAQPYAGQGVAARTGGERHTPRPPPHRVTHIRSYPPLDFFTPLAPTWFSPRFSSQPARGGSRCCYEKRASNAACVALVGMDEIWWLDVDSGDESPGEWYEA